MNILLAGGTGFIGKHLQRAIVGAGHKVTIVTRQSSRISLPQESNIKFLILDLEKEIDSNDLNVDAIINLVGIIREFPSRGITFHKSHFEVTRNLVDFASRVGIKRFLQMSALGVRPDSTSGYISSKYESEKYIQRSGLEWTIFRPSVVFGAGDHFVTLFSSLIRRYPFIGVVGDGEYKLQPVHVDDICFGFVKALTDDSAVGRVFEIGGSEIMTFNKMLDIIGEVLGKRHARKIHVPLKPVNILSSIMKRLAKFPITPEQIDMLLEGSYTEDISYYEFLGRAPIPFKLGISEYLRVSR